MNKLIQQAYSEVIREKTVKVLAKNLGCAEDVAEQILKGMDQERKELAELCRECAAEMA